MKKIIFALILGAIIIVSANTLSYLKRAEWVDNPVSIVIQLHDDGWCKIFLDGVEMKGVYESAYFPKSSTSTAYCKLPLSTSFHVLRNRFTARISYDESDIENLNSAGEEQVVIRKSTEQRGFFNLTGRGIGSGAGLLHRIEYYFIEYTFAFNVGVQGKKHVIVGSANRTYSWDL